MSEILTPTIETTTVPTPVVVAESTTNLDALVANAQAINLATESITNNAATVAGTATANGEFGNARSTEFAPVQNFPLVINNPMLSRFTINPTRPLNQTVLDEKIRNYLPAMIESAVQELDCPKGVSPKQFSKRQSIAKAWLKEDFSREAIYTRIMQIMYPGMTNAEVATFGKKFIEECFAFIINSLAKNIESKLFVGKVDNTATLGYSKGVFNIVGLQTLAALYGGTPPTTAANTYYNTIAYPNTPAGNDDFINYLSSFMIAQSTDKINSSHYTLYVPQGTAGQLKAQYYKTKQMTGLTTFQALNEFGKTQNLGEKYSVDAQNGKIYVTDMLDFQELPACVTKTCLLYPDTINGVAQYQEYKYMGNYADKSLTGTIEKQVAYSDNSLMTMLGLDATAYQSFVLDNSKCDLVSFSAKFSGLFDFTAAMFAHQFTAVSILDNTSTAINLDYSTIVNVDAINNTTY